MPAHVRSLLTLGNKKVGESVHIWSLPAGGSTYCPGRSATCEAACYAQRSRYLFDAVRERLESNYQQSLRGDFADRMAKEILRKGALAVRIHGAGDVYSAEYARKWIEVFRRCPKPKLWAYSRSWRCPEIWEVLREWAAFKNVRLWLSADKDTGLPEDVPQGARVCWLQTEEDEEIPPTHLVFRVRRLRRLTPRIGLRVLPVCPNELGTGGRSDEVTCGSCQRCLR